MADPTTSTPAPDEAPLEPPAVDPAADMRLRSDLSLRGRTLRQHAAQGTIINGAYQVFIASLGFVRGFIVAGFLTTSDYGVWGILAVALGTLFFLKQVGVGDKYIQQDEPDQELAFQKAFTLEMMFTGLFLVLLLASIPVFALAYGQSKIISPGLVLALAVPAAILQTPLWVFYRRMDFLRQRTIGAIDPLVGFAVTIGLAVAGFGYWGLVIGTVVGSWAGAIAAIRVCPYKLALRYDSGTLRSYASFSWPLFTASASRFVVAQSSMLVGARVLGLRGAGFIALASSLAAYTSRVDTILTATLYPAICAVKDRTELLFESFVKSNRIALMWGVPFGVGLALFTPDLISYAIGEKWRPAETLLQAFGLIAATGHIAYNWDAYFRARGDTRPLGLYAIWTTASFVVLVLPLLIWKHLDGFALGMCIQVLINLAVRTYYITRFFDGFAFGRHAARAIAPTVPAVLVVLVARLVESGGRNAGVALAEVVLYVLATIAATWFFERALLRELVGYLRRRGAPAAARVAV